MNLWRTIATEISQSTGETFDPEPPSSIGGGCVNRALRITGSGQDYLVKLNSAERLDMFEAEREGLQALAAAGSLRVPQPVCSGLAENQAYLVMEYIELSGSGGGEEAGQGLADLHRHQQAKFGWHRDNTIGSTHQPNDLEGDWIVFWSRQRLGYQLQLACGKGGQGRALRERGDLLLSLFPALIDHRPEPSLLHGDLWGGNLSYDRSNQPVIYDPAVYFGDREADLAMTELFGGFGHRFYAAYNDSWPLDPGYGQRRDLYNLYHILNHFNMFGGGYGSQAARMIDRLLAELGH